MSRLPVVAFTQAQECAAIDKIVEWSDQIAARMSSAESHRRVRDEIKDMLRSGALPRVKAKGLAREYVDVDEALKEYAIEMLDVPGAELPVSLAGYVQDRLA